MAVRIQIRRDTTQNWYEINPVLSNGEIGIEFLENGKNKIKIGNGVDTYSNLEYFNDIISYEDLLGKPQINGIELVGNNTLADLGIQPVGSYASYEDVVNGLALKADIDNTYTKYEVDTFFNNLLKIPALEGHNDQYLKLIDGEIVWSDITGDIVSVQLLNQELNKKVDKVDGYSLIAVSEIDRLSSVTNYDDTKVKEDIDLLKAEVDTKASINQLDEYVSEDSLNTTLNSYALKSEISSKANASDLASHVNNRLNPHNVTPAQIGLGAVNNTSDMNKPISVATQTALNAKQDTLTTGYGISIENNVITNTVPNVQSDWNEIEGNASILNKPNLATVATSGSYNDLSDKPYIPADYVLPIASETELGGIKVGQGLIKEADGKVSVEVYIRDYNDLEHKPSIGGVTLIEGQTAEDLDLASAKATQSELNLKADLDYVEDNFAKKSEFITDLSNKADKATTLAGYGITDAYTKAELDGKIGAVYTFKGSVAVVEDLPLIDNNIGDTYNVEASGANYTWDGNAWDKLSETIDLSLYVTKEEYDTGIADKATKEELETFKTEVNEAVADKATKEELEDGLADKADKTELSDYASMDILQVVLTYLDEQIQTKADTTRVDAIVLDVKAKVDETDYATADKAGVVRVGDGLSVTEDGILSSSESKTFEDTGLKTNQITNCLLENPQLVDLELVDGTLTLKAGSTIIIPYGTTEPIMRVGDSLNQGIISDITWYDSKLFYYVKYSLDKTRNAQEDGTRMYFIDETAELNSAIIDSEVYSGTTEPSAPTEGTIWYDTTNNIVKRYIDGAWTIGYASLPFCIGTNQESVLTSIDRVFQSIGYIDKTVWVNKGIKGLIPNGFSEDGTLNNITQIVIERLWTGTYNITRNIQVCLDSNGHMQSPGIGSLQYSENDNKNLYDGSAVLWTPIFTLRANSSGQITSIEEQPLFQILDRNDTQYIAHQAMPSDRYIDLTLGDSLSTYTAPADGYYLLNKSVSGLEAEFINLLVDDVIWTKLNSNLTHQTALYVPIKKGSILKVQYTASGSTNMFRFYYAEGSY